MRILCGGDDLRLADIALNSSKMPSILNSFLIFLNIQVASFVIICTECDHSPSNLYIYATLYS